MASKPHRPRGWVLRLFRVWHAWAGVLGLTVLVLVALTGIYLNHTNLFRLDAVSIDDGMLLTTGTPSSAAPLSPFQALEVVRAEWGDVPLQFIQLRQEGDHLVYKVRRKGRSDEATVDARSGRLMAVRDQLWERRFAENGTVQVRQVSWTRLFYDLHTGRILGDSGKLIIDAGALALLLLVVTGVYLFVAPRWRRRRRRTDLSRLIE